MLGRRIICIISVFVTMAFSQALRVSSMEARAIMERMNYQGYLTDTLGIPISDTLEMVTSIHTQQSAGIELWSQLHREVVIENGIFHMDLGPIPDTVFTGTTGGTSRWLQLEIEGQVLSHRTPILAVGYAYKALLSDTADYAKNVTNDNDWVRATPDSVLFTANQLGIARGGAGNVLYGDSVHTHANFGIECTTGTSGQDYLYATVSGGLINGASHNYATVGGGYGNVAGNNRATVSGGGNNTAISIWGTVAGGINNYAGGNWGSTVCGGNSDTVHADYGGILSGRYNLAGDAATDTAVTVVGGYDNSAYHKYSFVGGGRNNSARRDFAVVVGGYADTVRSSYGGILSGYNNQAGVASTDTAVVIVTGKNNRAYSNYAFIGGGTENVASGEYAYVANGLRDTASGDYSFVGNGYGNIASGDFAVIVGGRHNDAVGKHGGVLSGRLNVAGDETSDSMTAVAGGFYNDATARFVFIGGGKQNEAYNQYATISGGSKNKAGGEYSAVGGGYQCQSYGDFSFTANDISYVHADHSNSTAFNSQVTGSSGQTRVNILSKVSGTFSIDHPLDPTNKILNHYFVESPEMVLIYRGVAVIGDDGFAEVHLPDYFDALNRNPMVQLTGVGTSDVFVAEEVSGNRFVIGGQAGTKVYWTVTGDRKDQSAEITRVLMPVEQPKEKDLIGHSLDDDCLVATKIQLDRMGVADRFKFRTEEGRQNYESMVNALSEVE